MLWRQYRPMGCGGRMGSEVFRLGDAPDQDAIDRRVREFEFGRDDSGAGELPRRRFSQLATSDTAGQSWCGCCTAFRGLPGLVPPTIGLRR